MGKPACTVQRALCRGAVGKNSVRSSVEVADVRSRPVLPVQFYKISVGIIEKGA